MEVALYNRQRAIVISAARLQTVAEKAPDRCLAYPGRSFSALEHLAAVEVTLVSDRVIARLHRHFLHVKGPTDVITFPHGEVVISAETAARQARQHAEATDREVARYIVHGFLHLHGHEDAEPQDAAAMWWAQEQILDGLWPAPPRRLSSTG